MREHPISGRSQLCDQAAIKSCGAIASSAISSAQNMRASSRADSVAKRGSGINSGSAAWRSVVQCISTRAPSQRTQVVGDVAEFPDHLGITENSGGRIAGATECDRADMTLLVRKRLGTHHGSVCIEAFDRLPRRDALVSSNKRQGDEVGFFRHLALLA